MPTNVNPAVSPAIQPASRSSETKTDKIIVNKDGGSSSGFAKQTDVKFTNSVDNMSAVLEKISTANLGKDNALPQQLRDMINNVVTKAFSLESSLAEGLGSAMASERYSLEQLTSLGRIFQQLGNMAEAGALAGEVGGETAATQLSDALQAMLSNVKTVIADSALGGNTADLELVQLTKLAFQMLNNGSADSLPENMSQLLKMLSGQQIGNTVQQGSAAAQQTGNASQAGSSQQQAGSATQASNSAPQSAGANTVGASQGAANPSAANTSGMSNQQGSGLKQLVDLLFPKLAGTGNASNAGQAGANPPAKNAMAAQQAANAYNNAGTGGQNTPLSNSASTSVQQPNQSSQAQASQSDAGQVAASQAEANQPAAGQGQTANGQTAVSQNQAGQNMAEGAQGQAKAQVQAQEGQQANTGTANEANNSQASSETAKSAGDKAAQTTAKDGMAQSQHGGISPKTLRQAAELENNPLFKQIFSRYGYSQDTGIVRQPQQANQQALPQLPNNQQTVDSFRNLAELLLKDSNLSSKDASLLKNFVNGTQTQLSEQDAKQLNLLLKMVQSNVPAAIQQAGQQQGMEGLPKLWAFLQLSELGSLRDLKAKDFKNANKEIKTVVASMKNSITSEGSYQADGQKSISFVMPLYIGEGGHSYPAYINLYDEPEHEDECGRKRKDTWFRVCVLTDNIGAVDIVCQLFEGNNLNLRINFSSQDVVQDFGEYLSDIRKALYDTSIHLNDLRVGTVN